MKSQRLILFAKAFQKATQHVEKVIATNRTGYNLCFLVASRFSVSKKLFSHSRTLLEESEEFINFLVKELCTFLRTGRMKFCLIKLERM